MILSVSRRTDIPAFYSEWFFNRLSDGEVMVRNPMNPNMVSKIKIDKDVIDCIIFWTKDARPMLNRLDELKDFNFYFQYTVSPYTKDLEPNVPAKSKDIINSFIELSSKIGKEKVIWRYDPILISEKYTIEYHEKYFEELAFRLKDSTNECVISFIDIYRKNKKNAINLRFRELYDKEVNILAEKLQKIANKYNIRIKSCSERYDLSEYGIEHSSCIDKELIENIIASPITSKKDKNQRAECGCIESIDIGAYNTCLHFCQYCYANFDAKTTYNNNRLHNKTSKLLFGELTGEEKLILKRLQLIKRAKQVSSKKFLSSRKYYI